MAKNVFHLHGARRDGQVVFRKKLRRPQFAKSCAEHPLSLFAMEACATAHYWARELMSKRHAVRVIPPIYVKPFVKRHKNDAADADVINEAAPRPNMSFVVPKPAETQALSMMMRKRDQLLEQRIATANALRGHLAEFGRIAPVGLKNVERLRELVAVHPDLPELVVTMAKMHFNRIDLLSEEVDTITGRIMSHCADTPEARPLQTMPGIGPIAAMVIEAFALDMKALEKVRDFAACLGLVPKQHLTGGKTRLGQTSKMGKKDIRRAQMIGAMSCIAAAARRGKRCHPWLQDKLDRKPTMVAAVALANRMARQVWASFGKQPITGLDLDLHLVELARGPIMALLWDRERAGACHSHQFAP